MSENRLISVVVPVYNVEAYLAACLDSLLAQTRAPLEIVCVNDGSTDQSGKILDQYAEKDPRIRVIAQENGGLAHARNTGLEQARGEYVAFVDSDDTVSADFLEKLAGALESRQADIAVCDMEYRYEDGRTEASSGGSFSHTRAQLWPALVLINNSACNKLYRRRLLNELSFPDGMLYEDLGTIPALLYAAAEVVKVNAPLYYYRQRAGSIRHALSNGIFDIYPAIARNIEYVQAHGKEEEVLAELKHLYIIHALDAITLKIKKGSDRGTMLRMLEENMRRLKEAYPEYEKDSYYLNAGFKKKLIWKQLAKGNYERVLKMYGR
jgi:glycosyltransferase involved in cell wall biosynthesis